MYITAFDYILFILVFPCVGAIILLLTTGTNGILFQKSSRSLVPAHVEPQSPSSSRKRRRRRAHSFTEYSSTDEATSPMRADKLQLKQPKWAPRASEYKFVETDVSSLKEKEWKEKEQQVDKDLLKGFVALGFKTKEQLERTKKIKESEKQAKQQELLQLKERDTKKRRKKQDKEEDQPVEEKETKLWEQSLSDLGIKRSIRDLTSRKPHVEEEEQIDGKAEPEAEEEPDKAAPKKGKGGKGDKMDKDAEAAVGGGETVSSSKKSKKEATPISAKGLEYLSNFNREKQQAITARHATFAKANINVPQASIITSKDEAGGEASGRNEDDENEEKPEKDRKVPHAKNKVPVTVAPWKAFKPEIDDMPTNTAAYPELTSPDSSGKTKATKVAQNEVSGGASNNVQKQPANNNSVGLKTSPRKGKAAGPISPNVAKALENPEAIEGSLTPAEWKEYRAIIRERKAARNAHLKKNRPKEQNTAEETDPAPVEEEELN